VFQPYHDREISVSRLQELGDISIESDDVQISGSGARPLPRQSKHHGVGLFLIWRPDRPLKFRGAITRATSGLYVLTASGHRPLQIHLPVAVIQTNIKGRASS